MKSNEQGPRLRFSHILDFDNRGDRVCCCVLRPFHRLAERLAGLGNWHTGLAVRAARSCDLRVDRLDDAYHTSTSSIGT